MSTVPAVSPVMVKPGATPLTRMPWGPSSRGHPNELAQPGLGHAVVREIRVDDATRGRVVDHDRARDPGRDHRPCCQPHGHEDGAEVHVHHPVPLGGFEIEERHEPGHAGTREHVARCPQLVDHARVRGAERVVVGHVACDAEIGGSGVVRVE